MGIEIERKFLVKNSDYKAGAIGIHYVQGYLSSHAHRVVRVRIIEKDAFLTIKGPNDGASRIEYEYPIPYADALELLKLCEKPILEKYRYKISYEGLLWEVDEFLGDNAGLVVAEVELENEHQLISLPLWVGDEVTYDLRYRNSNLIHNPYSKWHQ